MDNDLLYNHPPPELLEQLNADARPAPPALDGRLKPLPRGRTGPYSATATAPTPVPAPALDLPAIIAAVFSGMQQGSSSTPGAPRTPQRPRMHTHAYTPYSHRHNTTTPDTLALPSAGRGRSHLTPLVPVPAFGNELSVFLVDFSASKRIAIDGWERVLADLDFTPDVIAEDDFLVKELQDALDIRRGTALKVKSFARVWNTRLELARDAL
jgi:hypothetical protein